MKTLKERVLLMVAVSAVLIAMGGCWRTIQLGEFTMLSAKKVDVSGVKLGNRVRGQHCIVPNIYSVWFPPIHPAMTRALEKGKGDILLDVVVSHEASMLFVCSYVEGTVAQSAVYKR